MAQIATVAPPGPITRGPARGKLGAFMLLFFMLAALGPLLTTGGTVSEAYAVTGLTSVPAGFALVALVLALFSVGFLAVARRVTNAGSLYAVVTHGLGRPAGVPAALVALLGYSAMQVSLYGMLGTQAAAFIADNSGFHPSWWACALAAWVLVAAGGQARVQIGSVILGVFSILELVVIAALAGRGLTHPAGGQLHFGPLNPARITVRGLGPVVAIAVLGFLGFEQAGIYGEEAREGKRTLVRASVLALAVGALGYTAASWSMVEFHGASGVVTAAQAQGPDVFFAMWPGAVEASAHTLFLTSLVAAALAYHNAVTRYIFSLARDRVLPETLAITRGSDVPRYASALQSATGLAAIGLTLLFNWNPLTGLFYIASSFGGYTVMIVLAVAGVAVLGFFLKDHRGESAAVRLWLPGTAAALLIGMVWACTKNLATLLGVPTASATITWWLGALGTGALFGLGRALVLKSTSPLAYAGLAPIMTEDAR